MKRWNRSFFEHDTLTVARSLIGARLHFHEFTGVITETEAYIGQDDPACHAAKGLTPRTAVMFGPAGTSYVYLIYGMYHCLNIVTENEGFPAAVLIRGVYCAATHRHLDGPGKLCKSWGITRQHNGIDMCNSPDFFIADGFEPTTILTTPRIGIKVGTELNWRFLMHPDDIYHLKTSHGVAHP
jgi:DNA-3-methyladenine glycosylase